MLTRRRFLGTFTATLLAAPHVANAQQAGKIYRLGMLGVDRRPIKEQPIPVTIVSKLRELGWEEGRNLSVDHRFVESPDALPALSTSLIASKPDVLVALGPYAAHALKDATQTIPIVFDAVADPVGRGLVASLARPGGNITGISHYVGANMAAKPAELLKEFVPRAQRIAWLINPANPIYRTGVMDHRHEQLATLKLALQIVEARSGAELPAAFEAAVRGRADGLVVTADSVFSAERRIIPRLAEKHKLPTAYPHRGFVDEGGLFSYSTNFIDVARRTAVYVDKVLRGTKPADLPIEQPTTFEMIVNAKTAKALGLTVPRSVLLRADQVIE
jgi:ABC-type uncharacterized transport system substrate-binding protein